MFTKRKSFNLKRRIASDPSEAELNHLKSIVTYGGNPEHKRNPGDFGLTPPASPRPDKTLCDGVEVSERKSALKLLKDGVQRGLVSVQVRNQFPQNIWAVTDAGFPLEAQLENPEQGSYHGYPMPLQDAFREKVIAAWNNNPKRKS